MRDQFVGDIGDFFKYGLLRSLNPGRLLGVAWYLVPDDPRSTHGGKIGYLDEPQKWRHLDPQLFDTLKKIVDGRRSVKAIEISGILGNTRFSSEPLHFNGQNSDIGPEVWRQEWFARTFKELSDCDLVFADPDNTLCEDSAYDYGNKDQWARIPLFEAQELKSNRPIVIYHHNNREGPHKIQNEFWAERLGRKTIALRFREGGARTFFVSNCDEEIENRVWAFYEKWSSQTKISLTTH